MKKAKFQIMQKTNIKYERDEAEIETPEKTYQGISNRRTNV